MRIRCSPLGPDFPRDRFLTVPTRVVIEALDFIDNEERRHYNLSSSTAAKLCMQLVMTAWGFAGGKGPKPKVELKDFLPFPDWQPPEDGSPQGPDPETRNVLITLVRQRRIPMPIYTQLITPPEISID